MKTVDLLHQLIHALSKSEKRAFKLFNLKYDIKANNSTKLFDALNQQKEYNEEKLKTNFQGQKLAKNLSYEKHKLQQLILDFLGHQSKSNVVIYELNLLSNQIHILLNKEQWQLAIKLLQRGIKLAEKHELSYYVHNFYKTRLNLMTIWETQYDYAQAKSYLVKLKDLQESVYMDNEYYRLYTTSMHTARFEQAPDFTWLVESSFFKEENKATTFEAKLHLYDTKTIYFEFIQDYKQVLVYSYKILALFDAHPQFLKSQLYNYFVYQFNHVTLLSKDCAYQEAAKHLHYIKNILYPKYQQDFGEDLKNGFEGFYTTFFLDVSLNLHQYQQVYNTVIDSFQTELKHDDDVRRIEYLTFLIISCFALNKYKEAIKWSEKLEQIKKKEQYIQELFAAKLFLFLCHYELGSVELLNSLSNNINYYCKKQKLDTPYHKVILKKFRKLSKTGISKPPIEFWFKMKDNLLKTNYQQQYGGTLIYYWLESKIKKISLTECLSKQAVMTKDIEHQQKATESHSQSRFC